MAGIATPAKTLYLLRHAKSSWDDDGLPDHDRALSPRGVRAARRIAAHMARVEVRPELVLCSSATRTRQTLEALMAALDGSHVSIEPDLYGASAQELFDRIRAVPDGVSAVLVIGHNPGVQDLACALAHKGDPKVAARMAEKFPTCGLAAISVRCRSWSALTPADARVMSFDVPRELNE